MAHPDPVLNELIDVLIDEEDLIPDSRKSILNDLAKHIQHDLKSGEPVRLNFICTHNSRRSQMAQIWSHTAATLYQIPRIESYSGGTEVTSFHPNAIRAMRTLGFSLSQIGEQHDTSNPQFEVHLGTGLASLCCYSKRFGDAVPSGKAFTAIMTCSDADQSCPIVPGAKARFPLTYEDPKKFDGTAMEQKNYLKTALEIGRELIYTFRNI